MLGKLQSVAVLVAVVFCISTGVLESQVPLGPDFDPSDVYFQAYLAVRAGEQLEKDEDFADALKKYEQAVELFGTVGKYYPDWKPSMVKNRLEMTVKAIGGVREKAGAQVQRDKRVIAELEGGQKVGAEKVEDVRKIDRPEKGILEVDALEARRLKEAEAEVARLKQLIAQAEARQADANKRAGEAERLIAEAARRAKEEEMKRLQALQQARQAEEMKQAALAKAALEEQKRREALQAAMSLEERKQKEIRDAQASAEAAAAEAARVMAEAQAKAAAEAAARARAEEAQAKAEAAGRSKTEEAQAKAVAEAAARAKVEEAQAKAAAEAVARAKAEEAQARAEAEAKAKVDDAQAKVAAAAAARARAEEAQAKAESAGRSKTEEAQAKAAAEAVARAKAEEARARAEEARARAEEAQARAEAEGRAITERAKASAAAEAVARAKAEEAEARAEAAARAIAAEAQARAAAEAAAKAREEEVLAKLQASDARSNEAMRNASRVDDLLKNNESLNRKLKAAEDNVRSLRAQMATAPVKSEMDALNRRIENLAQEREAMAMALNASRQEHTKALSQIETLNADVRALKDLAAELRQKEVNLERDLKKERNISNEVVAGQRRQLEQLEKTLEERTGQLKSANEQIAGLRQELEEAREAFAEMKEENEVLMRERDQMAALLKLNDGSRIEQLIEQSMGLAKQLREANEKVERLNLDSNAAKDDLVDALRDLAIAKSMINRLQQDKKDQDKRIEELTQQLENEEKALVNGEVHADAAEVEMLREVIRRQLRMQERRRQAKELLVEAARDLGKEDHKLEEAIALFDMGEIELTPEEQKLVADQQVDGEFVSPFARDRETVGKATNELLTELDSYDRAARKAYLAGRLMPTRELYELMLEQHPGHVPALCKLGVVHLKLDEPGDAAMSFQKAIELDESNAYATRMLGYCYLKLDDLASADSFLRKAVDLAPDDAKSHLLLGMVAFRMGSYDDAEGHFKGAITADPMSSDAHFNLALVHSRKGKLEAARKSYSDALERGAVPDQALEKQLMSKQ